MVDRGRVLIALTVVAGHVLMAGLLVRAMRPAELPESRAESMVMVDFSQWRRAEPEPDPELSQEPAPLPTDAAPSDVPEPAAPPAARPTPRRHTQPSTPMEAVIAGPEEPAVAQWRVAPSENPFSLPPAQQAEQGFGRRDQATLPSVTRPRVAGAAPPNPIIPQQRMRRRMGPGDVVQAIGSLIGGGPDAAVEAPCGGRMNGGDGVARAFSPAWNKHYGCAEDREAENFDGTFAQPPGTVR